VRELESTAPEASSACTATYAAGPGVVTAVSKPLRGAVATGTIVWAEAPASTRQLAVRVSPFQLAYTLARPPEAGVAAIDGALAGAPVQAKR